jgi:cell division ATPase FtsA
MHKIDMDKKDYIVGIDIGSSYVAVAVGVRKENGEV